jgi:putative redox protein
MKEIVQTQWLGGMKFTADIDGFKVNMDAHEEFGGQNSAPSPKPLLLASLAGCTGIDVVSILGKMKVGFDKFEIIVKADLSEDHPKYYEKIHLVYEFWGTDLPADKIEKAILLSKEKYCGVSRMLSESSDITWEARYNS